MWCVAVFPQAGKGHILKPIQLIPPVHAERRDSPIVAGLQENGVSNVSQLEVISLHT